MALCNTCQTKTTVNSPGSCAKCSSPTTHFAYRLCDSCSTQLDECEWCRVPLSAGPSSSIVQGSTPYFITLRDNDNGKTPAPKVNIGEQVHIVLEEDQYQWREYDVKTYDRSCFRLKSKGQFVPSDPNDPQYGTRTFIFDVVGSGTGDIKLHEVQRTWSWGWGNSSGGQVIPNGKTWEGTVEVK